MILGIFIPIKFGDIGFYIVKSCKNEEEVAQTVEILHHKGRNKRLFCQCHHPAFGTARHGAAHIALRAHQATARQNEPTEWSLHFVDFGFEQFHIGFGKTVNERLGGAVGCQIRPKCLTISSEMD